MLIFARDMIDHSTDANLIVPRTRALNSGSTFLPYIEITKNFLGDIASGKHKFLLKVGKITFREQSKPPPYMFCFPRRWVLEGRKSDARARVENWVEPPECSSYCADCGLFVQKLYNSCLKIKFKTFCFHLN